MAMQVEFSPASCVFLALLCLVIPVDWLMAMILAAAVHELCHILAVVVLGGKIYSLKIGALGAVMDASAMKPGRELVCVLAGSAGSLTLFLFRNLIPRTAAFGLVQGLYNLLPLDPLDGGRAVQCILALVFPADRAAVWYRRISVCTLTAVAVFLILCCFWWKLGIFPMLAALMFVYKRDSGKIYLQRKPFGSTIFSPYKMR